MSDEDWDSGFGKSVAVYLNGHGIPDRDARGERVTDDSFILCFNAHHEPIEFTQPPEEFGASWLPMIDTFSENGVPENDDAVKMDATVGVYPRSVSLFKRADRDQPLARSRLRTMCNGHHHRSGRRLLVALWAR